MQDRKKRKPYTDHFFKSVDIFTYQEYMTSMLSQIGRDTPYERSCWKAHLSNLGRANVVTALGNHIYCLTEKLDEFDPYYFFSKKYPKAVYMLCSALKLHGVLSSEEVNKTVEYYMKSPSYHKKFGFMVCKFKHVNTGLHPLSEDDVCTVVYRGVPLSVSSIERTILDLFSRRVAFRKMPQLFLQLLMFKNLDVKRLSQLSLKEGCYRGNATVGYFLELYCQIHGIQPEIDVFRTLEQNLSKRPQYMFCAFENAANCVRSKRWKLYVPKQYVADVYSLLKVIQKVSSA